MRRWIMVCVLLAFVLNGCSPAHTADSGSLVGRAGPGLTSCSVPPRPEPESGPSPAPAGGAGSPSIEGFEWLDRDSDRVDTSGITLKPGRGKDEHFRLTLKLPPATVLEDLVITGGGMLRWTTRPSNRYWPIAIFQDDRAVNKDQVARVGTFSGKQIFDLYIESHDTIRPDHTFSIEVAISVRDTTHVLRARCRRHGGKG